MWSRGKNRREVAQAVWFRLCQASGWGAIWSSSGRYLQGMSHVRWDGLWSTALFKIQSWRLQSLPDFWGGSEVRPGWYPQWYVSAGRWRKADCPSNGMWHNCHVSADAARPSLVCMCCLQQPLVAQGHPSLQGWAQKTSFFVQCTSDVWFMGLLSQLYWGTRDLLLCMLWWCQAAATSGTAVIVEVWGAILSHFRRVDSNTSQHHITAGRRTNLCVLLCLISGSTVCFLPPLALCHGIAMCCGKAHVPQRVLLTAGMPSYPIILAQSSFQFHLSSIFCAESTHDGQTQHRKAGCWALPVWWSSGQQPCFLEVQSYSGVKINKVQ